MRGAASAPAADAIMMVAARRDSLDIRSHGWDGLMPSSFWIATRITPGRMPSVLITRRRRIRLTTSACGSVALLFRFEVVPRFGVMAADDGDRIGALLQRHEGVDFGGWATIETSPRFSWRSSTTARSA